jgi:hypothetical protein
VGTRDIPSLPRNRPVRRAHEFDERLLLSQLAGDGRGGLLGASPDATTYAAVFWTSTGLRVAALLLLPFVHTEVLHAIPIISTTLAVRLNAGSIESPIPGSMREVDRRKPPTKDDDA